MNLDIVLRTCSNSQLTRTDIQRVCGDDRNKLIRKCFFSLVQSIKHSKHDITLNILDDHSDAAFIEFLNSSTIGITTNIIHLEDTGANASALAQFKQARACAGLVYIVEDDYLHEPDAIDYLVGAYIHFTSRFQTQVVVYPYDCSLRYVEGTETQTLLLHDGIRYWRSVDKTANTMFTHYSVIDEHWDAFENLAKNYPTVMEDDTINLLYQGQNNPDAPIRAFNPIPSIAYHVGYSTPTAIQTTHTSWQHLWNVIPNWELVQGWFYSPEFYRMIVDTIPDNSIIIEIGAWRGKSTCCMASLIQASDKKIEFYTVDTWQGSDEAVHQEIISALLPITLYEDFQNNLRLCGVEKEVNALQMTSVLASEKFADQSVDCVFIDGAHDYMSVVADIEAWLPKIKPGGLIAGDDYSNSWPDVMRAVNEKLSGKFSTNAGIWYAFLPVREPDTPMII